MTRITISGCQPYDGDYELDFDQDFTTREWGWIKRLAGYLPLAMTDDAFGDPELVCVLGMIAMRRAGRVEASEVPRVYERLSDTAFGSVMLVADPEPEEAEQDPPPLRPSSSAVISGGASAESSATSAPTPTSIGTPGSGTSASAPVTLAS